METLNRFVKFSLIICLLLWTTHGYEQELNLHEDEYGNGNYLVFRNGVPDTSSYILNNIKRICYRGLWRFYSTENYGVLDSVIESKGENMLCMYGNVSENVKSFRSEGAKNTGWIGFSFYTGYNYQEEELYIPEFQFENISKPIRSFGYTGKYNWTLYEGPNYDGKSVCVPSPWENSGYAHVANVTESFGLETVGSFKNDCIA